MAVISVANKQLLASVLLFLLVGLSWPDSKHGVQTAVAQGTSSDSAGYTALVVFRVNASSPLKSASGIVTVWNPTVTRAEDYSLGKVSIARVELETKNITASMESGYIVFPAKYGDNTTRFYVRWKNVDANGTRTGCFDLDCKGFVPSKPGRSAIGRRLTTSQSSPLLSERRGRGIDLLIRQNLSSGNWELIRNNQKIGYWPASLFSTGKGRFNIADLGGEVYDSTGNTSPTSQMGNGVYPTGENLAGAYIYDAAVMTNPGQGPGEALSSSNLFYFTNQVVTNPTCYGPNFFGPIVPGITSEGALFYGGPGCGQQ